MFKADDNGEIIYFQSTGQLVAQMYETEGMRQFTHANVTAVLTKKGASSGNIIIINLNRMCVHLLSIQYTLCYVINNFHQQIRLLK